MATATTAQYENYIDPGTGASRRRLVPQFITQFNERQGNQKIANPNYVPAGLFKEGSAAADKVANNIDASTITDKNSFLVQFEKFKPVVTTPVSYTLDRGGARSGGESYYSSVQDEANRTALYAYGIQKGYIKPYRESFLDKTINTAIQAIVIGGITAGFAGIAGVGPAAGGGSSSAASSAAASDAGTLYAPAASSAAPVSTAHIAAAAEGVEVAAVPHYAEFLAVQSATPEALGASTFAGTVGAGVKTLSEGLATAATVKGLVNKLGNGSRNPGDSNPTADTSFNPLVNVGSNPGATPSGDNYIGSNGQEFLMIGLLGLAAIAAVAVIGKMKGK